MNTLILIFCSILLMLIVGAIYLPILRGSYRGPHFFTMDGGRGKKLKLQRRVLIENLRDIAIEKDGAKLSAEEFERLAAPLHRELEEVDRELERQGNRTGGGTLRGVEHFCPVCGARDSIIREPDGTGYCEQCGSEISPATQTA